MANPDLINQELEQYETDLSWVLDNYATLIEAYPNEFIAVLNKKVLTHGRTIQELKEALHSNFPSDAHRAVIEFIYPEHPNFVLPACA
ncbi:MAG TPA: DUF5678 domain-containing protein [Nitrospira sp.]|nr:DUF5678 domain-containing protein [Nitrospira sp.]